MIRYKDFVKNEVETMIESRTISTKSLESFRLETDDEFLERINKFIDSINFMHVETLFTPKLNILTGLDGGTREIIRVWYRDDMKNMYGLDEYHEENPNKKPLYPFLTKNMKFDLPTFD